MTGGGGRGNWIRGQVIRLRVGGRAKAEIVARLRRRGYTFEEMRVHQLIESQSVSSIPLKVARLRLIDFRNRVQRCILVSALWVRWCFRSRSSRIADGAGRGWGIPPARS